MDKHQFKKNTVYLIIVALCLVCVYFIINYQMVKTSSVVKLPSNLPSVNQEVTSIDTPDGSKTLTMKKKLTTDSSVYSFYVTSKSDPASKLLFSKTLKPSDSLSIPFNSFSPDNNYLFLKEKLSDQTNYYVFPLLSNQFKNGTQYLNVTDSFNQKLSDVKLVDITGWAAPNLLIVNTDKSSLWFDITSFSFIQLAIRFN